MGRTVEQLTRAAPSRHWREPPGCQRLERKCEESSMGTLRGGNGGEQPPNGGGSSDGLPELPPEWGFIAIPDDLSELDSEADEVRRELRREARRNRWRRRLRLPVPHPASDDTTPSLTVPLVIMAIAVVATLTSLFAIAWPGRTPQGVRPDAVRTSARPLTLPDLTLLDSAGAPVRIRDAAPAVIMFVDGCACEWLVSDMAAAVDPRVSVLVVTTPDPVASTSATPGTALPSRVGTATSGPPGVRVRTLVDPAGALRAAVPGLPSGAGRGAVLLVSADWAVVRVLPAPLSVADLKPDLERLPG
jgi:hypothetical protein